MCQPIKYLVLSYFTSSMLPCFLYWCWLEQVNDIWKHLQCTLTPQLFIDFQLTSSPPIKVTLPIHAYLCHGIKHSCQLKWRIAANSTITPSHDLLSSPLLSIQLCPRPRGHVIVYSSYTGILAPKFSKFLCMWLFMHHAKIGQSGAPFECPPAPLVDTKAF